VLVDLDAVLPRGARPRAVNARRDFGWPRNLSACSHWRTMLHRGAARGGPLIIRCLESRGGSRSGVEATLPSRPVGAARQITTWGLCCRASRHASAVWVLLTRGLHHRHVLASSSWHGRPASALSALRQPWHRPGARERQFTPVASRRTASRLLPTFLFSTPWAGGSSGLVCASCAKSMIAAHSSAHATGPSEVPKGACCSTRGLLSLEPRHVAARCADAASLSSLEASEALNPVADIGRPSTSTSRLGVAPRRRGAHRCSAFMRSLRNPTTSLSR